ncbi:hypothetical protein GWN42_11210, partial [candidate division KSB1 bacterium]|nr:hypothetical protein [candidate division KSB1 bacterium]
KTGPVFVSELGLTSNGRPVRTIDYRRNGIVTLSGSRPGHNGKPNRWEQTYRNTVPLDD